MAAVEALQFFGALALVAGFLLLCLQGTVPEARRGLVAAQAIAVGLAAAALAIGQSSILLGVAALVLLAGQTTLALRLAPRLSPRLASPAGSRSLAAPVLGVALVVAATLAVPEIAGIPREGLALGLGAALLGAVALPGSGAAGLLALANGVALTGLMLRDPELALAVTVLALLPGALAPLAARMAGTAP